METPNLISKSSPVASLIDRTASCASNKETEPPQVTETIAFLAPLIDVSSKGDAIAPDAASRALPESN